MNEQRQQLYRRTALLGVVTEKQGNTTTYAKAKKFGQKLFTETLTIAFAGHFSAGKSSMINELIGENLLATSPIPTSANIVTIQKSDQWKAYVHFMNGDLAVAEQELEVANLKKWRKMVNPFAKLSSFILKRSFQKMWFSWIRQVSIQQMMRTGSLLNQSFI